MASLVVDTNNLVNHLEASGFTRKQAEGVSEALHKLDTSALATKVDVERLETKLEKNFIELRSEFKQDISGFKADLYKWLLPILLSQIAAFAAVVKIII